MFLLCCVLFKVFEILRPPIFFSYYLVFGKDLYIDGCEPRGLVTYKPPLLPLHIYILKKVLIILVQKLNICISSFKPAHNKKYRFILPESDIARKIYYLNLICIQNNCLTCSSNLGCSLAL